MSLFFSDDSSQAPHRLAFDDDSPRVPNASNRLATRFNFGDLTDDDDSPRSLDFGDDSTRSLDFDFGDDSPRVPKSSNRLAKRLF